MSTAIVIGGGITGLTAAFYLRARHEAVFVIEPETEGGVIRTKMLDGFTLEQGPNVLLQKPELSRLLSELGLSSEVRTPAVVPYKQQIWADGRILNAPRGLLQFLKLPLGSFTERARILPRLLSSDCLSVSGEDCSVADFFEPLLGRALLVSLLDPALRGIYGGDISRLSARALFPGLWAHAHERRNIFSYLRGRGRRLQSAVLRGGMQSLVERLVDALPPAGVKRGRVVRLQSSAPGSFDVELESGERLHGEEVYVATSGAASASYLSALIPELASRLSTLRYAPLVVVHCELDPARVPHDSFGVLLPSSAASDLVGVMYNSMLFPHVAPAGKVLATVCLGGAGRDALCGWTDEQLSSVSVRELREKLSLEVVRVLAIQRWSRAIPQYEVGHMRLVSGMDDAEKRFPGLCFIGADRGGIGVPDRVREVYMRKGAWGSV